MTNNDMIIGVMKGIEILIEGCRGTDQGKSALKEWDKWRASECHGTWGFVPKGEK